MAARLARFAFSVVLLVVGCGKEDGGGGGGTVDGTRDGALPDTGGAVDGNHDGGQPDACNWPSSGTCDGGQADECGCPPGQLCVYDIDVFGNPFGCSCAEANGCDPRTCSIWGSEECEAICDACCTNDACRELSTCFDCEWAPRTLGCCWY